MDKRKGNTDLTEGKVWKVIVRFALPLLVGNLLQQFYNITDSIIVGQFLGKEALAAVSASFFIYYFIISLVIGVGSGTTVVISQLFGAKQYQKGTTCVFLLLHIHVSRRNNTIHCRDYFRRAGFPPDQYAGRGYSTSGSLFSHLHRRNIPVRNLQ